MGKFRSIVFWAVSLLLLLVFFSVLPVLPKMLHTFFGYGDHNLLLGIFSYFGLR